MDKNTGGKIEKNTTNGHENEFRDIYLSNKTAKQNRTETEEAH